MKKLRESFFSRRERELHCIEMELESRGDLLASINGFETSFQGISSWKEFSDKLGKTGHMKPEADRLLRAIIGAYRQNAGDALLKALMLIFWKPLLRLFRSKEFYDVLHEEDIWQDIVWFFVKAVNSVDTNKIRYPIALEIRSRILSFLYFIKDMNTSGSSTILKGALILPRMTNLRKLPALTLRSLMMQN